jgi:Arc/MetJ family transcription regulator
MAAKRTSVNLDQELVRRAGEVLGTRRTTDTLHEAMREVVRLDQRRRLSRRDLPDLSLDGLERMRRAREPRQR